MGLHQFAGIGLRGQQRKLSAKHRGGAEDGEASRNLINALIVLARRAGVVRTLKGKTRATAPVLLALEGPKIFQESVIRCDTAYLEAIRTLSEPFDVKESALAIYDNADYAPYLQQLLNRLDSANQTGSD